MPPTSARVIEDTLLRDAQSNDPVTRALAAQRVERRRLAHLFFGAARSTGIIKDGDLDAFTRLKVSAEEREQYDYDQRVNEQRAKRQLPPLAGHAIPLRAFLPSEILARSGLASNDAAHGAAFDLAQPLPIKQLFEQIAGFNRIQHQRCTSPTTKANYLSASSATAWIAENPGSDTAISDPTIKTATLSLKTCVSVDAYTKQLALSATPQDVADILAEAAASGLRNNFFGKIINNPSDANAPSGILQSTFCGTISAGGNGGTVTNALLAQAVRDSLEADVGDPSSAAFVMNPRQQWRMQTTERASGSGYLIDGGGVMGMYPYSVSNRVPKNLTQGTATTICSPILFGPFSETIIGDWSEGNISVQMDPVSLAAQAKVRVVSTMFTDFAMFDTPGAFQIIQGCL